MITFKVFLSEGGWGSTVTQTTKLTPAIAKKAVAVLPQFETDFNEYLKNLHMAPIKIGDPVGSSAYIERDLKNNPNKEYGDIDVIFVMPRLDGFTESKNNTLYRNALTAFTKSHDVPSYMFKDEATTGHHIIVKVDDGWVQVDLVTAFFDTVDWTTARMTPEHNLKGALLGFLYASLAEVLHLSLNTTGVLAKELGGELVPFKKIKVDKVHTFSVDIEKFLEEILVKFYARISGEGSPKIVPLLKAHPGMKKGNIQIKDLISGIKGLGMSFAANDMFGKKDLKHISDQHDFIEQIKKSYRQKIETALSATKFDKAETPDAIRRAKETKDILATKSKEILDSL